jgi:hypothetical protein
MLTCRRLLLAFLACSTVAAQGQPAVPAVPPAPGKARPAAQAAAKAAPKIDPDAPPTSDGPVTAAASPASAAAADAPPTSDAPTSGAPATAVASTAPNRPTAAAPPQPAVPPTVTKNYPLTPEGNARFLADYAARPDVKKLEDGVLYRVLRAADPKSNGPIARGDVVTVSYRGWLIDGQAFDQTKVDIPAQFSLNAVVPGWRTALMKMKVGDLWEVAIPADQAYGAEGRAGRIPPNQSLIFVISLAKVEYAG